MVKNNSSKKGGGGFPKQFWFQTIFVQNIWVPENFGLKNYHKKRKFLRKCRWKKFSQKELLVQRNFSKKKSAKHNMAKKKNLVNKFGQENFVDLKKKKFLLTKVGKKEILGWWEQHWYRGTGITSSKDRVSNLCITIGVIWNQVAINNCDFIMLWQQSI